MRLLITGMLFFALTTPALAETDRPVGNPLTFKIPDTTLIEIPLVDVIGYLRDVTDANIHVHWRALEDAGISRDTPITIDLRAISMRHMLRLVLEQAAPEDTLAFYLEDGVIEITTREVADRKLITRVYPVEDLLMVVPDFYGPQINISQVQTSGRGGGGGGQGLFSGSQTRQQQQQEQQLTGIESGEQLVQLIQETVQPEIWRENGGTASIRFFRGSLIITAPRSVHEAIGQGTIYLGGRASAALRSAG